MYMNYGIHGLNWTLSGNSVSVNTGPLWPMLVNYVGTSVIGERNIRSTMYFQLILQYVIWPVHLNMD